MDYSQYTTSELCDMAYKICLNAKFNPVIQRYIPFEDITLLLKNQNEYFNSLMDIINEIQRREDATE